jgi:5-deoxy-glucuronate isomerase
MTLHMPAGTLARAELSVHLSPTQAGWTYSGLRVLSLAPGESYTFYTAHEEMAVLPLSGGSLTVEAEVWRFELTGRTSVFARVTDCAYLPIAAEVRLSTVHGCEIALPSAVASRRFDPAYIAAESVPVDPRGAGPASRQVNNFLAPGFFDACDKLVCCELITPDGNWSSYPPHRHDGEDVGDGSVCTVMNEEIYYFRIGVAGSTRYGSDGFGMHRTYTADHLIDENVVVRDGDVFVVPRGYHGPCIAAPGYPMYYLNVLAGPGAERSMAFCDDPAHHWVRDTWNDMPVDPRIPVTTAAGVRKLEGL